MSLLRDRRFALLVSGQAINGIGSWCALVALWGYASYRFDAGPAQIALLSLSWSLPAAVFGPLGGLPVDRFGPRHGDHRRRRARPRPSRSRCRSRARTGCSSRSARAWAARASSASRRSPRSRRVSAPDDELLRANALIGAANQSAIAFGPLLAAGAIAGWGLRSAFLVDAVTYVIGIAHDPAAAVRARSTHRGTAPGSARSCGPGSTSSATAPRSRACSRSVHRCTSYGARTASSSRSTSGTCSTNRRRRSLGCKPSSASCCSAPRCCCRGSVTASRRCARSGLPRSSPRSSHRSTSGRSTCGSPRSVSASGVRRPHGSSRRTARSCTVRRRSRRTVACSRSTARCGVGRTSSACRSPRSASTVLGVRGAALSIGAIALAGALVARPRPVAQEAPRVDAGLVAVVPVDG